MSTVRCHISMSLDGYVAGPNQTRQAPLGEGGEDLHEWAIATESWQRRHGHAGGESGPDSEMLDRVASGIGAHIMGRRMFDGGEGPLDESWKGWWGDDPPYHTPVYVLTHHQREPLEMEGGTTFFFVNDGIGSALEQARAAAGDRDILVAGGAEAVQQYLAAGLLDELLLHVAPVFLRGGARLLDNVGNPALEPVEAIGSPRATHLRYRVKR